MPLIGRIASAAARGYGLFANIVQAAVDPYFNYVVALLHGDGTNGGQNNTFLDSSSNNFTITRNGNTTQGSFSPFSQTGWSNYFDGTGDYLTLAPGAAFGFGTGDFTVETWFYYTGLQSPNTQYLFDARNSGQTNTWAFHANPNANTIVWFNGSSDFSSSSTVSINQWNHVAYVRSGTTGSMYFNGVRVGTQTDSTNYSVSPTTSYIGVRYNITEPILGYMSNARVVKGTAVYSGTTYTVPTAPLTAITNTSLLTCQSNRFRDASTNNFTITRNGDTSVQPFSPFNPTTAYSTGSIGGSGYFDGSGDYLNTASNAAFALGSGNFTMEMWVYSGANGTGTRLGGNGTGGAWGANRWVITTSTSANPNKFTLGINNASPVDLLVSTSTFNNSQWMHVAIARSGNAWAMWVNGAREAYVASNSAALDGGSSEVFNLGRSNISGDSDWAGYVSGFKMVKGTAVYDPASTTITVPTSPATNTTNTSLLLSCTNGAIFDNAAVADYETAGNAQISTSVKKYGTGSLAFDGNGDGLTAASAPVLALGSGDFTVEGWVYFSGNLPYQDGDGLYSAAMFGQQATGGLIIQFRSATSSAPTSIYYTITGTSTASVSFTFALNTWYHIAVSRAAGTVKIFVNGTQVTSFANTTNLAQSATQIGWLNIASFYQYFLGYIDDVRVSKGIARYTYNFTPPTAALPDIGGTVTLTADPYYEYTTLLLPGNGTNGAQNNTFLDSSTNAFTITRNGNTTQGTFSPFSQTGWGNYFDGSGDYLTSPNNAAIQLDNSTAFTLECWFNAVAFANQNIFRRIAGSAPFAGYGLATGEGGAATNTLVFWDGSTWRTVLAGLVAGQWYHFAATYEGSGTTLRFFVNGTQQGSALTCPASISNTADTFAIGAANAGTAPFTGYVSNLRIVKGTAVYTSNFTVPTTPLTAITNTSLLTCQSNRFIDNSSNAFAITRNGDVSVQAFSPFNPTASWSAATYGGSGYFDGSGDYLTLPTAAESDLNLTGTFTFECWFYCSTSGDMWFFSKGGGTNDWNSTNGIAYQFMIESGSVKAQFNTGGSFLTISATAPASASWNHFAIGRNGTTLRAWLNGASMGTSTTSISPPTTRNIIKVGANTVNGSTMNGYLAGMIVVNGTDVYGVGNTTITIPTAPPTAITNTKFLANFTNAGIYDATAKNDLETVGNAQISTTQSKFGGSSMYFDGNGDVLSAPDNEMVRLSSGDFTIECWVYPTANGALYDSGFASYGAASTLAGWFFGMSGSNTGGTLNRLIWSVNYAVSGGAPVYGNAGLPLNTWSHAAVTKFGTTISLFINGVLDKTATVTATPTTSSTYKLYVGAASYDPTGTQRSLTGYINDLRITKGIARYTRNFTPPTTAFLTL